MSAIEQSEERRDFLARLPELGLTHPSVQVGNLEIFPFLTDHTKKGWEQNEILVRRHAAAVGNA